MILVGAFNGVEVFEEVGMPEDEIYFLAKLPVLFDISLFDGISIYRDNPWNQKEKKVG